MSQSEGVVGSVWAVLSLRHNLNVKDVFATSHCALFQTKEEAVAFARRIEALKRNWRITVSPIAIFTMSEKVPLPEQEVPFHDN